jgi:ankyrin repeat protein
MLESISKLEIVLSISSFDLLPPVVKSCIYFTAMKSYGADVSVCDYDRRTPLHVAASEGDVAMVKYLMQVKNKSSFEPKRTKVVKSSLALKIS